VIKRWVKAKRRVLKRQLTQNKVSLVDDTDYKYLSQWKWYANRDHKNWYAVRHDSQSSLLQMHREILKAPKGVEVDLYLKEYLGKKLNGKRELALTINRFIWVYLYQR